MLPLVSLKDKAIVYGMMPWIKLFCSLVDNVSVLVQQLSPCGVLGILQKFSHKFLSTSDNEC